jgi:hypothetical protein
VPDKNHPHKASGGFKLSLVMRVSSLVVLLVVGFFRAAHAAGDPYSAWAIKHFGTSTSPKSEFYADPNGPSNALLNFEP